jgi:hypothetical protein
MKASEDLRVPLLLPWEADVAETLKNKQKCTKDDRDDDDDDDVRAVWMVCFARVDSLDIEDDSATTTSTTEATERTSSSSYVISLCLSILLPVLLCFQFAIAFENPAADTTNLQWGSVQLGVCFFVLAGCLYRQSIAYSTEERNSSLLLQLLPEIITDIILLLVLLKLVATAVVFMHFCTIVLAVNAVLNSSCICSIRIENDKDDIDSLDSTQHDRLPLVKATVV